MMTKQSERALNLGEGSIPSLMIRLALPSVIAQTINMLYNMVDRMYIGAIPDVGAYALTGVGLTLPLITLISAFSSLFGTGGAPLASIKLGEGNEKAAGRILGVSAFMLMCTSAILFLFIQLAMNPLLIAFGASENTLPYAGEYLRIYLFGTAFVQLVMGLNPFISAQGCAKEAMLSVVIGAVLNIALDPLFIFTLGMGVRGAALATVLSRYVECAIIMIWTHRHKLQAPFIEGAYRSMLVPLHLVGDIFRKGMPLLVNEFLWSAGMATLNQAYSTRGLAVVASMNICSTISNLFNVVWLSMGTVVAIMVGQQLGASEFDRAKTTVRRLMLVSLAGAVAIGVVMIAFAPLFPRLYNTTEEVRYIASRLLMIVALAGPVNSFCHCCYFTLRSGGKTWITFLFDSAYLWVLSIPLARLLTGATLWPILPIYVICTFVDVLKALAGGILIKKVYGSTISSATTEYTKTTAKPGNSMILSMLLPVFIIPRFRDGTPQQGCADTNLNPWQNPALQRAVIFVFIDCICRALFKH